MDNSPHSKDVVLILHGWKRSSLEWLPVAEKLSDRYKIIVLDLPGFGGTLFPEKTFDIYDYADFTKAFLLKMNIKHCIVLGHSFGGRIGIILAAKTDMVSRLILVDSAGREYKNSSMKLKLAILKILKPVYSLAPAAIKEHMITLVGSEDYKNAGRLREVFKKIVNEDLTYLFSKISTPVYVVWGENDRELPVTYTKHFKKFIPESIIRIVWGAGHSPHAEKYQQFMQILEDFI